MENRMFQPSVRNSWPEHASFGGRQVARQNLHQRQIHSSLKEHIHIDGATHQLKSQQVKVPEAVNEYPVSQATVTAKASQATSPSAVMVYPVVSVGVVPSSAVQPERV